MACVHNIIMRLSSTWLCLSCICLYVNYVRIWYIQYNRYDLSFVTYAATAPTVERPQTLILHNWASNVYSLSNWSWLDQPTNDESFHHHVSSFLFHFHRPDTRPCNWPQTAPECRERCPFTRLRAVGIAHGEYHYSHLIKITSNSISKLIMSRTTHIDSGLQPPDVLNPDIALHLG